MKLKPICSIFLISSLIGCAASRPVLYDNDKYRADPTRAEKVIDECIARSEKMGLEGNQLADAGKRAGKGAVASAAAGGAGALGANAFGYNYDVGASAGASGAAGLAGNFALGLMDERVDPAKANYVETCLADHGYRTISWK